MSTRTSLSLAVAAALIAAGSSYGQQTSGAQAPRETAQQSGQPADQESGAGAAEQSTLNEQSTTQRDEQSINRQRASDQAAEQGQERQAGYRGESARSAQGRTLRLSEIMDLEVRNAQDEDLGSIEDVVVETSTGKIRYAAVSVGGFLGVGDRLIAVPWQSLRIQQEPNDDDKYVLLNADRAKIENAPGFNEENWPDFGNQRFSQEVDTYYGDSSEQRSATGVRSSTTERRSTSIRSSRDTQSPRGARSTNGATDTQNRQDTGTDTR